MSNAEISNRSSARAVKRKAVLGIIHLQPLPGTLFYKDGSFNQTLDTAVQSARALYDGGADGCLVQTVDRIYSVKDESDPALLGRAVDPIHRVEQHAPVERDPSPLGPRQAGDGAEDARLPRAGGPDESECLPPDRER